MSNHPSRAIGLRPSIHPRDELPLAKIQEAVATYFNVSVKYLLGLRRQQTFARPRRIGYYLATQLTSRSLIEIGKAFGGRDHTTVMHGAAKVREALKDDPILRECVAEITEALRRPA